MRTFKQIDEARRQAGLTRKDVYSRAEVDCETWRRTAMGKTRPNVATLEKLSAALDALTAERRAGK
jgi:ribosome-binding protein aMBF1 (putative translation factor)